MTSETRKVILLIDNAGDFIGLFRRVLEREDLANDFVCEAVVPSGPSLLEDCVEQISSILTRVKQVEVVLVDIVLDESVKPTEKQVHAIDRSGFQVAAVLRERLPTTPILGITQWTRIQMLLTDVTLDENFDGLLLKPVLTSDGFSKKKFLEYVEKAKRKRMGAQSRLRTTREIGQVPSRNNLLQDEKLSRLQVSNDPITLFQVEEIGERALDRMLYQAFGNADGTVKYFAPGFSGSKLFEVSGRINRESGQQSNVTSWIAKLSQDESNLQLEIDKHNALKRRGLSKQFYPALLSENLFFEDGWSAIITEKDPGAITLQQYIHTGATAADFTELLEGSIKNGLSQLYGRAYKEEQLVWQRYYGMKERHIAAIRASLDELGNIFQHQTILTKSNIERVDQFVVMKGLSHRPLHEYRWDADTRQIHGDFHSRNILVNPKSKTTATIDFPNSQQDHGVKDFAKLETDIIFSLMDAKDGNDTNWSSIDGWLPILESLGLTNTFFEPQPAAVRNELSMITSIRASANSVLEGLSREEYLMSFLFYSLKLLHYPDITLPKKAFVLMCANKILDEFA